jgi:hypothetical protein
MNRRKFILTIVPAAIGISIGYHWLKQPPSHQGIIKRKPRTITKEQEDSINEDYKLYRKIDDAIARHYDYDPHRGGWFEVSTITYCEYIQQENYIKYECGSANRSVDNS